MAVYSMTGYGKGVFEKDGLKLTVELKSVNHRFLDLAIKAPKVFSFAEDIVRKALKDNFQRGHFDIFLTYEDLRENRTIVNFDYSLVNAYVEASKKIANECGIEDSLKTAELLSLPDVAKTTYVDEDEEFLTSVLKSALDIAIKKLAKRNIATL